MSVSEVKDYVIIERSLPHILARTVLEHINKGYELVGGVSTVSASLTSVTYLQAMIKRG